MVNKSVATLKYILHMYILYGNIYYYEIPMAIEV